MKKIYLLLATVFAFFIIPQTGQSQVLAWNLNGALGNEASIAASTKDANLNSSSLTRGAGVTATALANAFSGSGWNVATETDAVNGNKYFQFTITASPTYKVSLSTLDVFFRRSSTGPNTFQWKYSLDGFATAGINVGGNISYTLTTTNGDAQAQLNLSSIPGLQDAVNPTTITIRLYGWGASAAGGTFAIGRPTASNSLSLGGTVSPASSTTPTINVLPASLSNFSTTSGSPSASQNFTVNGTNLTDHILVSPSSLYEVSIDNLNFGSSITINQSGGTVSNTLVYTRIKSSASQGAANGAITLTAGTASNTVLLSGSVIGLINLVGTSYIQNFNGIGAGLPSGVTVKTGATASAFGTDAAFTATPGTATGWSNTGGAFKNFASGNNDQGVTQSTATDRAIGVRQTGAFGDPGAAFVFQVANTSGKINFSLDFNLQSLDAAITRTTIWRVDYGFGVNPSSFTVANTAGTLITGGNTFSNTPIHVNFGNALDNQAGIITIRIVTLAATSGSGNRPSTGVDDFTLTWEDPNAKTITLNATSINFPVTNTANSSSSTYKIVSQTNLDQPIDITATSPYMISTDNVSFVSNLSVATGDAFDKTIYVKFSPVAAGVYPGTITHSSEGAPSKIINLSGEAIDPNALTFNFNTCTVSSIPGSGFLSINTTGIQKWGCSQYGRNSTNGVDVNGFSGGAAQTNEAWLISPALNLNNVVNLAVLSFYSRGEFSGPKLQLYVSTTYDGSSVPNIADWTELNGNFPTPPGSPTTTWTLSDNIDLTAYKSAPKVYIAFKYTSSSALGAARWSVDDIAITDQSTLLTVSPLQLNFGEVSAGGNSVSQPVSITAIGNADLTVTPSSGYQISSDNSSFTTNAIVIDQVTAAAGTTLYVRFSPLVKALKIEGNINVTAEGLNKNIVALTGSSYPKSETFDVAAYNISFFGAGSENNATPAQIATQVANITTVMQRLNMDVIGIEEMSNDNALNQLVANLPGYASVISHRWSYSFEPPDPTFPPQKIGFIYNTATTTLSTEEPPRVLFESLYDSARLGLTGHRLTDYPTGNPSSFWGSGRLPFLATFNATIDGATKKIRVVVLHAKSGGDADGYIRRQYDVKLLKDSLDAFYPNDKVMIIGDYNDRMVTSIYTGHPSSYLPYVNDNVNYNILTYPLDQAGRTSFPSSNGLIDHITISNELNNEYIATSTDIEDPRTYIANYNSVTASDHLPVYSRFQFCKLTCPANIIVSSTNGQCGTVVNFNIGSTMPCGTVTAIPASGSFFPVGTTTVEVTASNGETCSFTVTVNDTENPEVTCPGNQTKNTNTNVCSYTVAGDEFNATTSDNCSGTTAINDYNGTNSLAGAVFSKGTTTVKWTATDAAGNTSTCSFTVTVEDHQLPSIIAPTNVNANTDAGQCYATGVSLGSATDSDNCPGQTVSNNAPSQFPKGQTIVIWTVTDASGNTNTASQTVTVADNQNPTITSCPALPVQCYASSGNYTIPAIAAGDNCGTVTYSYSITGATSRSGNTNNASGSFNVGTSTIAWTVTDAVGNTATCQTTVIVNPNLTVSIPDAFALSSGTLANTVYIGYSPAAALTMTASASGGTPGYSYNWSSGSISSTATVSPTVNTMYTVTVTDQKGCQAIATKQIKVMDIRSGKKLDKVNICHNGSMNLAVSPSEATTHLSHGDMLGTCGAASAITKSSFEKEASPASRLAIVAMPNPSAKNFSLNIVGNSNSQLALRVMDVSGRIIEARNVTPGQTIKVGDRYRTGIYFAELMQGNERKIVKLVKIQ